MTAVAEKTIICPDSPTGSHVYGNPFDVKDGAGTIRCRYCATEKLAVTYPEDIKDPKIKRWAFTKNAGSKGAIPRDKPISTEEKENEGVIMPGYTEEEYMELLRDNPDLAKRNGLSNVQKMRIDTISPGVSEEDFQRRQIKDLQELGFLVHAERPARTKTGYVTPIQGDPGWLDIFAVHPVRHVILIIENKSKAGRLSPFQEKWVIALSGCHGVRTMVVRPEDWKGILTEIKED